MPTAAQTQAQSPRPRCTDVLARFTATALDVATAGESCALHCHTLRGTVVVVVPLELFAEKCRGSQDCNGRPLPALRLKREERLEPESALAPTPQHGTGRHSNRGQIFRRCETAWVDLSASPMQHIAVVCERHEIVPSTFMAWISANHRGELAVLRDGRRPSHKRHGLSLAAAADRREPLTKPGGGL